MDFTKSIKEGLEFIGDTVSEIATSIAEKNRLRMQLSHIKGVIKADSATRDQAYIELGRYFYENMRDNTTAENEAICAVIDAANDRISKSSLRYVELLNIQNDTKIRSENAEKLAKAVSEKAAAAANDIKTKGNEAFDKAKESAADFAEKAKTAASDLKDKADEFYGRFDPSKNEDLDELIAGEEAPAENVVEDVKEAVADTAEEAKEAVAEVKETVADTAEDAKEAVADAAKDAKKAVVKKVDELKEAASEESPADAGF